MKLSLTLVFAVAVVIALAIVLRPQPGVTVFAAVSLRPPLEAIGAAFQQKTGRRVTFSFAASDLLAKQILAGAPAHLLLSADEQAMTLLKEKNVVSTEDIHPFAVNHLVVVGRDNIPFFSLTDFTKETVTTVVVADPDVAPLGRYSKTALADAGVWDALQPRLRTAQDARAAVAAVAAGDEHTVGLAYHTDALAEPRVRVLLTLPSPAPTYYQALLTKGQRNDGATSFYQFLNGDEAADILHAKGFAEAP